MQENEFQEGSTTRTQIKSNYEKFDNNQVKITGKVATKPVFSHSVMGEDFYETTLDVPRLSSEVDALPITVSERLIQGLMVGDYIQVVGQFRSYNKQENEGKSKLVLTVFARDVFEADYDANPNSIYLMGHVCKPPIYRTTPFKREICDVLLAVNRAYGKSDYIPCIAWGRNARFISDLKVGDSVEVSGRIQSRQYQKKMENGEILEKTAYEVSIGQVQANEDYSHVSND